MDGMGWMGWMDSYIWIERSIEHLTVLIINIDDY